MIHDVAKEQRAKGREHGAKRIALRAINRRFTQMGNSKEQRAKRIAQRAERKAYSVLADSGPLTTDYRLLTSDPDPGIDDRESVVCSPLSVVCCLFTLLAQYSALDTQY